MSQHIDATHLKVGDIAPNFTSIDQEGQAISLSDYKGKKVVLYFYPADNTPGCTNEAFAFRDTIKSFDDKNMVVMGVSPDSQKKHKNF